MFKIKTKSFKDDVLESITFQHINIDNLIEFTIEKEVLVFDNSTPSKVKYRIELDGLCYYVYIFSEKGIRIGDYYDKYIKNNWVSENSILISYFNFCTEGDIAVHYARNYFIYIVMNFINTPYNIDLLSELQTKNYSKRKKTFTGGELKFNYLGLGSEDKRIKLYIEDCNHNIYDAFIEIVNVDFVNQEPIKLIYANIPTNGGQVRVLIGRNHFLFHLMQLDHLSVNNNYINEKFNVPFHSLITKLYKFIFPNNLYFVAIFSDWSIGEIEAYEQALYPLSVLQGNFLNFDEYQNYLFDLRMEEEKKLEAESNSYYENRKSYDEWNDLDDEAKRWNDMDRWLEEQYSKSDKEEERELEERNSLENYYYNYVEFLYNRGIELRINTLSFRFVSYNKKRSKLKKRKGLFEDYFVELTCVVPPVYNNYKSQQIKKVYLKKLFNDRDFYIGHINYCIIVFTQGDDVSYLNNYFNIEFKLEMEMDKDKNSGYFEFSIYKADYNIKTIN